MAQTRDAIEVTFALPEALRAAYLGRPGQFVTLEAAVGGETVRRSYSLCAPPSGTELRVAIKRVADGAFSQHAYERFRPGARVSVAPPSGRFFVEHDPAFARHYVAIAAGSGITPIFAILRHVLETEPRSRVTLVYGNRSSASVMFREELQGLKDRYLERLTLVFVMSRETQDVELFAGRIDRPKVEALLERWIEPGIDVAFVCGPPEMTEAAVEALVAHGVPRDHIKTELFAAGPRTSRDLAVRAADAAGEAVDAAAVLDGREYRFAIEPGETVLAAGLRQGIDLPYSCMGGVCSTCRAKLVTGDVEMDVHYALEDYEIARGLVLLCQSYPRTNSVVVDVDAGGNG